uniref:Reverse transcriptase domain-containing protein n=1 Tax=Tanacetum cinerariifolium TaxID=118510 RepID=A0A6L2KWA2_TANCI|nr:reverse transcriptase domain-containing protein [Tanacetum cinerariifolium]
MIHMPKGAKVLKDLLSHKDKLEKDTSSVKLSKKCFAIIQRSLPQKEGDLGSFTLPCLIGPLAVKYPIGVCENLLVKISKFVFPFNFVVLGMDKDELVLIILGRPFLATARAVIDIHEEKMSLKVKSETITFNIRKSMKSKHSRDDYLYCVDHTAKMVQEQWVDTVNHVREWSKEEEGNDPNEVLAVVPKKGGVTVVNNEKDELISQWIVTGCCVCIDYRAENLATGRLSQLENPDFRKLTRVKIRDLFLEEKLMEISDKINEPCGPSKGHHGIATTARKVFEARFYWPHMFRDTCKLVQGCDACQRAGNISSRDETLQKYIQALISDRGTHFCNHQMEKEMKRYEVVHRFSTAYHPETNGQVENTNRAIKRILEKTIRNNRKDWSYKLNDALWAFQTALKTPLGTNPFRIIYGKACHLFVKLEHNAYWAIKNCNMDLTKAKENRFLQINELDEMRLDANEPYISYKERTKKWHDKRIKLPINYERGDKILLFNSHLRLFPEKLKPRWYRPFSVSKDIKNRAIELYDEEGSEFIVNKQ